MNYWREHFASQVAENPEDHASALDFSNEKLMGQVHDSVIEALEINNALSKNGRLLDIGCGLGDLLSKLSEKKCDLTLYGADIVPKLLAHACKEVPKPTYFIADITRLPINEGSFDATVSSEALQYTEPHKGLRSLIDVTREDGVVIVTVPNAKDPIIQQAVDRNEGRFTPVTLQAIREVILEDRRVSSTVVKPLVFKDEQKNVPYEERSFVPISEYKPEDTPNRFVISISL